VQVQTNSNVGTEQSSIEKSESESSTGAESDSTPKKEKEDKDDDEITNVHSINEMDSGDVLAYSGNLGVFSYDEPAVAKNLTTAVA
jgi:hypothetical protein